MGDAMGIETNANKDMATSLVGLAGDLASYKNVRLDVANTALNGIYTGEGESLKQMGIIMTDATLKQYMLDKGMKQKYETMTQAEKVQLRYNYVMEMGSNAIGDFEKTGGNAAGQMRVFTEGLKQLGATIGEKLLPVITPMIAKLNEWVTKFGELDSGTQSNILKIGLLIAIIGPLILVVGMLIKGVGMVITVVNGLGAAFTFLTSPIGLVILAIAAVVAAGVLLYQNWEYVKQKCAEFGEYVSGKWNDLKTFTSNTFSAIGDAIMSPINWAKDKVYDAIESIKGFFDFDWEFPSLKLPHFSITGGSFNPLKWFDEGIPKIGVEWYSKGGIFTQPTVLGNIGVGDAQNGTGNKAEAVMPIDDLRGMIKDLLQVQIAMVVDGKEFVRQVVAPHNDEITSYNRQFSY